MRPGDLVDERYEIIERAGAGGMGTVYRAVDQIAGHEVAVKVVRRVDDAGIARFLREASWLAELAHPGIVRYVGHGATATGEPYMVMEWLEGESLERRLARGGLSVLSTVTAALRIADPLALAHRRNVIHRDLKPSNIFLVEGDLDHVKLLDFGIARRLSETHSLTGTGRLLGTSGYMSPEQIRGERGVDARTDVFSLGCVLFECLTGRKAFPGREPSAILAKILLEDVPDVRDFRREVPGRLARLVTQMLQKDREDRPADATEVADALTDLMEVLLEQSQTMLASIPPRPALTEQERRLGWAIGAAPVTGDGSSTGSRPSDERLAQIETVVRWHGGTMQEALGGVLGIRFVHEGEPIDSGARAARCALMLRSLLPGWRLALVAGVADRSDLELSDGLVETALDLAGRSGSGPVRLNAVAARLLEDRFVVEEGGPDHELLREPDPVDAMRRTLVLGRPTPCVGRQRELSMLDSLADESFTEGVCRPVLVTGEPGIGKSRLEHELLSRLDSREEEIGALVCHGDPLTTEAPFALLGGAVRRAAGILEGEPAERQRQQLRARLAATIPGGDDSLGRISELMAELIDVGPAAAEASEAVRRVRTDPGTRIQVLGDALVDWLRFETEARPLLLVLENLPWGDLQSVQLVQRVVRELRDTRLLVVALARPEVHDRFPELRAQQGWTEVQLGPLTPSASQQLVRHVLGPNAKVELVERLVSLGGGNPFYLEELIRAAAEGSIDERPHTVLGMVQARFSALSPGARRALRAASIFGERFWKGGVAALLDEPEDQVESMLEELVWHELVVLRRQSELPGEQEYLFRQALVRDAAYALLTDEDRGLGHSLAAHWLREHGDMRWSVLESTATTDGRSTIVDSKPPEMESVPPDFE